MATDAGAGDFVVLDVHAQMDVGRTFHLHALLYQERIVTVCQAVEMMDCTGKGGGGGTGGGVFRNPHFRENMRAWNFAA